MVVMLGLGSVCECEIADKRKSAPKIMCVDVAV